MAARIGQRTRFKAVPIIWGMMFMLAIGAAGLPACTKQEGRAFSKQEILALKPGRTTEREVLRLLGPPDEKRQLLGDGLWTYRHIVHHGIGSMKTTIQVLLIRFDDKGVVQKITRRHRGYQSLF